MKKYLFFLSIFFLISCTNTPYSEVTIKNDLRAPAYPLLTLHPHVTVWSAANKLMNKDVTFANGNPLPFVGFLRVDGAMYCFMGEKELSMQAVAPIAFDNEKWEAKFTFLTPDEGWEQPVFDDKYWQIGEGAFGIPKQRGVNTGWLSSDIWVRREANIDPYLLEHKKMYLRYSYDGALQLYINGKQLINGKRKKRGKNIKIEVPDSILNTMKEGKILIAAHGENKKGGALVDFGLFAEDPIIPVETVAPISYEGAWVGKYVLEEPKGDWKVETFDDTGWMEGQAAFGTKDKRNIHTPWTTKNIWVRRAFTFDPSLATNKKLYLRYSHDDVFQLYINGKRLLDTGYEWKGNARIEIPDSIIETMKNGKALIAAHCENREKGGMVDFGLYAALKEAQQTAVDVQPTQTHYTFLCGDVELKLSFTSPYLLSNLEVFSRPINYISYKAKALDGKNHDVSIYFELDPHKAFQAGQSTQIYEKSGFVLMKTGKESQKLWVNKDKDKDFPAWGKFYLGAKDSLTYAQGDAAEMRTNFMKDGDLKNVRLSNERGYSALTQRLNVNSERPKHLIAGFDGLYTMAYFGEDLRPYWNKNKTTSIEDIYKSADDDYEDVMAECYAFDRQLMVDAYQFGGKEYAELCALAYRQTISAFQLSESSEGDLLCFNTRVGPVDMYYSASPLFLCYNPELLKAMLNPFFYYSESGKWNKPFPARDLGGYPIVNGQTQGHDMPVEEAGNMLIMTAAIARVEKDAAYAKKHWETLSKWANYLLDVGLDTKKQLSADHLTGKCPHNTNLSIKSIIGLASFAQLAEMSGEKEESKKYMEAAKKMATEWEKEAYDGDHYRLAFDTLDSWSQKYNLIWDRLLDLNVFSDDVIQKEITFYASKMNTFGCPLDSRHSYAKTNWTIWAASLNQDRKMFRKFILPLYQFMNTTKERAPMENWIYTKSPNIVNYSGRPLVGAYFIGLLENKMRNREH